MIRRILNFASFQVGWFATVLGAAHGYDTVGPVVVGALVGVHLAVVRDRRGEGMLLAAVGATGFIVDSVQISVGVFTPATPVSLGRLCPPWLLGLWVLLATTLNHSLTSLHGKPLLAGLLGAGGGALSYFAGARIGAITLGGAPILSVLIFAAVWAVITPLLFAVAGRVRGRPGSRN